MEPFSALLAHQSRWFPFTKASDAELWYFFCSRLNKRLSKQSKQSVIWDAIALIFTVMVWSFETDRYFSYRCQVPNWRINASDAERWLNAMCQQWVCVFYAVNNRNSAADLCFTLVTTVLYIIPCYKGPWHSSTRLPIVNQSSSMSCWHTHFPNGLTCHDIHQYNSRVQSYVLVKYHYYIKLWWQSMSEISLLHKFVMAKCGSSYINLYVIAKNDS